MTRVLIVHFTPPSTIGGVESVIRQHAALLSERGIDVELVAGRAGRTDFPLHVLTDLDAARSRSVAREAELDRGLLPRDFEETVDRIRESLAPLFAKSGTVIVHNAFTLHFSLPLTAALCELARERDDGSVIAWCHDISWINPLYSPAMHPHYPWNLLRQAAKNVRYVTVSHERKGELARLWGKGESRISVVPNGIDVERFLRLSPTVRRIVRRYRLFDRDAVILLPVRITRRKNIETGIRAVRSLFRQGLDVCFLISGPVAPHHPSRSRIYLEELKDLVREFGLQDNVMFLADERNHRLSDRTLSELFALADILLFPSAQEGFGLPILEAGLARVPAVLSRIPIFEEIAERDARFFSLDDDPDTIARRVVDALDGRSARLFRRILREYRWEAIIDEKIMPLIVSGTPATARIRT